MSHFKPRAGEKVRNRWNCLFWKQNLEPSPGLFLLTNYRALALEGTELTGFWENLKPHNWITVVDRDLVELPPLGRSGESGRVVFLTVAGRPIGFDAEEAEAALGDIEHARTLAAKTDASQAIIREREVVIKEIVRVPCRFCGTLNVQTEKKCSSCGATIS